jgi:hypothetical protein
VTVTAETPLVQTASGERSFTVTTESVSNLPLNGRTFEQLLSLAPGVVVTPGALDPAARAGGGGGSNYMLDGATAMDPGINRPAVRISVESLAEVRLVTSTYQAEYARSAGLQINAAPRANQPVPRSVYNAIRNSNWNENRRPTSSTAIPAGARSDGLGFSWRSVRTAGRETNCSSISTSKRTRGPAPVVISGRRHVLCGHHTRGPA